MATLSIRLPDSIHRQLGELARQEGISINQLVNSAVAEKLSALMTADYLEAPREARLAREVPRGSVPSGRHRARRLRSLSGIGEETARRLTSERVSAIVDCCPNPRPKNCSLPRSSKGVTRGREVRASARRQGVLRSW